MTKILSNNDDYTTAQANMTTGNDKTTPESILKKKSDSKGSKITLFKFDPPPALLFSKDVETHPRVVSRHWTSLVAGTAPNKVVPNEFEGFGSGRVKL